jgi:hypothetical protein
VITPSGITLESGTTPGHDSPGHDSFDVLLGTISLWFWCIVSFYYYNLLYEFRIGSLRDFGSRLFKAISVAFWCYVLFALPRLAPLFRIDILTMTVAMTVLFRAAYPVLREYRQA